MRYMVSASIVVIIACLTIATCYALSAEDNGYAWNSADMSARVAICKNFASKVGYDYMWWLENINSAYDTTEPAALKWPIKEVATYCAMMRYTLEQYEKNHQ